MSHYSDSGELFRNNLICAFKAFMADASDSGGPSGPSSVSSSNKPRAVLLLPALDLLNSALQKPKSYRYLKRWTEQIERCFSYNDAVATGYCLMDNTLLE